MNKKEVLLLAVEALDKLSKLGNGDRDGNSIGNSIAREARGKMQTELAKPDASPVFWVGSNGGAMPDVIYQDWSKEYPEDAKYFRPLYSREDV